MNRRQFLHHSLPLLSSLSLAPLLSHCASTDTALRQQAQRIIARTIPPSPAATRPQLLRACAQLSRQGLSYQFGGETPSEGGLDCSGVIHYLLVQLGYQYPPRQSNHQYYWCQQHSSLRSWNGGSPPRSLRPGDLLFWKNTYNTGPRYPADISHVMIYMGRDHQGNYWQFGGRGSSASGKNGHGIDFHQFNPTQGPYNKGQLVGHSPIPHLQG